MAPCIAIPDFYQKEARDLLLFFLIMTTTMMMMLAMIKSTIIMPTIDPTIAGISD